jgi:hypothetical protein
MEGGSIRAGAGCAALLSCFGTSASRGRSGARSALGPVGGNVERPGGIAAFGAVGITVAFTGVTGVAGVTEPAGALLGAGVGGAGFDGAIGAALGLLSETGALQTLDPPKAGIEAGGDEARGAYLSLDASARLARRASSFPGSRRGSLAERGSIAREDRLE